MANYPINKDTDWISKEKRELFCKAVNSFIMVHQDKDNLDLTKILEAAKMITDKVFENYPDKQESQEKPL